VEIDVCAFATTSSIVGWDASPNPQLTVCLSPISRDQTLMYFSYKQIPTFGRGVIRKFGGNIAAMKKLAARDFEDILQVT
jgi:hypothetical protein